MMAWCWEPLLLLWLTAIAAQTPETENNDVALVNLTNKSLQVVPNSQNANITKLLLGGNLITLNETDQLALASYPKLVELHLDANRIFAIPASYFSVVPKLRVLSLTRNNISSLDPEAFVGLAVLTELDLSHNLLSSLPAHTLRGLNKLQILKLQENPWNCSCPLLTIIGEINAANITIGGPRVICASPAEQAGRDLLNATCSTSSPTVTVDPQKSPTRVSYQHSQDPFTVMMSTLTTSHNHSLSKDQTPVLGNTWKFTACVAVLALTTSALILCAIKGPSWYKLFHNYRHRRLRQEVNEEDEDAMATDFSETGKHLDHQTFTFERQNGQEEEEEEEYYEDPYIRREEANSYQQQETTPNHVQMHLVDNLSVIS
ncbi:LOW QUALITY PROTEIN: leucine-rich repeat-containing protein 19 [Archocentrus centrarchus]|uniref:LOW QUALITY PROTEIN: leucine-rich repeat-containing protein 19 n=1 Tax=Archocentrus centrarchus TaxID=63155 RepID=UPI0011E9C75E|nr:LOW QUALITY PROTEIN: leucine-rich repeat-containing protein 19 [Archocentrus centrarchus]